MLIPTSVAPVQASSTGEWRPEPSPTREPPDGEGDLWGDPGANERLSVQPQADVLVIYWSTSKAAVLSKI
jgi:hypothetical protein